MIRYIGSHKKVWFILLIDEQIGGGVVLICPSPTPWTLKLFFHHIIRPPPPSLSLAPLTTLSVHP